MTTTMVRHTTGSLVPELAGWLESAMRYGNRYPFAVEEFADDRGYVLRAELPGRDPQQDIAVTVANGHLTITAQREHAKHDSERSEFTYGPVSRVVSLPAGSRSGDISANYDQGILEVHIPVNQTPTPHRIPISFTKKS
jgi:HSP20 family protein